MRYGACTVILIALAPLAACQPSARPSSTSMSTDIPFSDPQMIAMAEAVATENGAEIARLAAQVHPDTPGAGGVTLLVEAIAKGRINSVQPLLDAGADPNRPGAGGETPMHAAAFIDDPEPLRLLLAHGGDANVRNPVTGQTPLARAILGLTRPQVQMLLDAGADPNAADNNGKTLLHTAGGVNAGDTILQLLKAGASPLAKNSRGETFQAYYFQYPKERLNERGREQRQQVIAWLKANGIPLEANVVE